MTNILKKLSYENEPEFKINTAQKNIKPLKIAAFVSFVIMLAAQILLLIFFDGEQVSDSLSYYNMAQYLVKKNTWYPSVYNLSASYFYGNGLVNFLALLFRFTDDLRIFFACNILTVQLLFWSCVYIIKKMTNNITAHYWFTILFCLLNTFWSEVVSIRTEVPFTALAFFAFALFYSKKKYNYVFGGIVLALANWIRPLGLPLLAAAVFIILYQSGKLKRILTVFASYAVVVAIIGTLAYFNCGYFCYQATTLGYNLIMTANDDADGSYMDVYSEGQAGYIPPEEREKMTFKEVDSYYKKKSIEWIKEHPAEYIKQTPSKIFYLFATETYSGSVYFNNEKSTGGISYIKELYSKFTGNSDEGFLLGDILICLDQAWYMLIFVLFLCGFVMLCKNKNWRFMLPMLIFVILGTCITIVIVGGARYHFPYLPIFMMYASLFLQEIIIKKRNRTKTSE